MDLYSVGIALLIVFLLMLVIRGLSSRTGRGTSSLDQPPYDANQDSTHPIHHIVPTDAGPIQQDSGHVGSRDMGADHHHHDTGPSGSTGGEGQ